MLLFKFCYMSAQIQTLRCFVSQCGCYLCHHTEQLTSKDKGREVCRGESEEKVTGRQAKTEKEK